MFQGDSGGPLVCRSRSTNTWTQAGVVSWGKSARSYNLRCYGYTVYTELSKYQSWIESLDTGATFTPLVKKMARLQRIPTTVSNGSTTTEIYDNHFNATEGQSSAASFMSAGFLWMMFLMNLKDVFLFAFKQ